MSEPNDEAKSEPPKKGKLPLILALTFAFAGGGGGFFATYNGMILNEDSAATQPHTPEHPEADDFAFIELDPMVISIGAGANASHLRFRAQLDVPAASKHTVEALTPRIIDILNGYLRALRVSDIEDVSALSRLRAQMLRRAKIVVGPENINDLLVMEFVIN